MVQSRNITSLEDVGALKEDLRRLQRDFADLLSLLKDESGDKLADLRRRIGTTVHDKAEVIRQRAGEVGERIGAGAREARKAVQEHPFTTAIAAFCIGLVLASLRGRHGPGAS